MWDELAHETRPVMVYGMGNGADKLFSRLEKYGVTPREVFASDGFVRGHSFRGYKVKSFSEIREEYPEFVILLSFGTNRVEVLDMLAEIDGKYDMYVPDMPVAGEEEYFDRDFYNAHYDEIKMAYDTLVDEQSRKTFSLILQYKISGRMKYLENAYSDNAEIYSDLLQIFHFSSFMFCPVRKKSPFPGQLIIFCILVRKSVLFPG